ncbi:fucose permease [Promicromonospora sp. AC04]|uniref:MFS transporter n=1 Tax=Promicromonospora sp. AC04 TaxID=2135723 RepID=UPI000D41A760|nr:MFS transporter [Promicromonospora sp. AC04]PUB26911.1 fucose permease [Promicromonospora sp. AC04]
MRTTSLTGARIAVAAAFFAQGFVFISLTTRLPRFLERWGLDEVTLSLLLLMMVLLAGVGSLVAERAARRFGSASMLRLGLGLMVVAVPAITLAPAIGVFVGGVAVYGIALGLVDATSNMQAVHLEHRYGRPILPSSHGYWTTGGILATILVLTTGHLSPEIGAFVVVVPLVVAFAPFLPHAAAQPDLAPGVVSAGGVSIPRPVVNPNASPADAAPTAGTRVSDAPIPWRPIWLVGAGLVIFYMVDTTASAWGPVYLARSFDAPGNLVALATFPYLVTSIVVRLAGGHLVTRFGVTPLLRIGAVVACGALLLVTLAPTWQVAVAGFTLLGASVALVAPLSFSAAGRIAAGSTPDPAAEPDRARTDAVIARFNQFNYVGALLGSVLTGLIGADNLRLGFALPAVLVLALVPLAPAFARGTLRRRGNQPATGPVTGQ